MQKAQKKIVSPSEFMRQIRPELHTDSTAHVATRTAVSSRLRRVCSTQRIFTPPRPVDGPGGDDRCAAIAVGGLQKADAPCLPPSGRWAWRGFSALMAAVGGAAVHGHVTRPRRVIAQSNADPSDALQQHTLTSIRRRRIAFDKMRT